MGSITFGGDVVMVRAGDLWVRWNGESCMPWMRGSSLVHSSGYYSTILLNLGIACSRVLEMDYTHGTQSSSLIY